MASDLTPEQLNDLPPTTEALSLEDAVQREDVGAQPGPEEFERHGDLESLERRGADYLSVVKWPARDEDAPDYAYVAADAASDTFKLTADVLEQLILLNRYVPYRARNVIAFALRGASLIAGHEVEHANSVELKNVRPDHQNFRCVIGFYFTDTRTISVYTGSTVPCRLAIYGYKNGGERSNLLPTGLHTFYIWRHKKLRPALRMGRSKSDPESGAEATVLRNKNDYVMETKDIFDLSTPLDNVHCSYYLSENSRLGATFSSWGCITVRGEKTPSEQWKKFQAVLNGLGAKERVDLLLATGKDVALAASLGADAGDKLTALRHGSRGPEVERLLAKLNMAPSTFFGAKTVDKLTGAQRTINSDAGHGRVADGIYSKAMDALTGWQVFDTVSNLSVSAVSSGSPTQVASNQTAGAGPLSLLEASAGDVGTLDSDNEPARGFSYLQERSTLQQLESAPGRIQGLDLPISKRQAVRVTRWLKGNFGAAIEMTSAGSPFAPALLCAIVCQETAYRFIHKIDDMSAADILGRCVVDGSGDYPGTSRNAYPRNTRILRGDYGDAFTDMLIEEGNKMRADLKGWGPVDWVYKGYGIFQYDLQFVKTDEAYFRDRCWYDMNACLANVRKELDHTYGRHGELWEAVRAYNGGGSAARRYKRHVKKFYEWCGPAWDQVQVGPTS